MLCRSRIRGSPLGLIVPEFILLLLSRLKKHHGIGHRRLREAQLAKFCSEVMQYLLGMTGCCSHDVTAPVVDYTRLIRSSLSAL